MFERFDDIEKLDNVKSVGSEEQTSPLQDSDVTLFLKNQYRVITTKSVLGESITIESTDKSSVLAYRAMAINSIATAYAGITSNKPKVTQTYEKRAREQYEKISKEEFGNAVHALVGPAVWDYLQSRHSGSFVHVTQGNYQVPRL
jgi:ApbE superfamily uncharacterized protein (UPF0280 family)